MEKDVQIVAFQIGSETLGLPISVVREIIRVPEITAVPNVHDHIRGVMNLRGRVLPVIDLRRKFGIVEESRGKNRIVVVELEQRPIGLIVDSATEVLRIAPSKIEKPSDVFTDNQLTYLSGVARLNDRIVMLLDLEAVTRESSPRGGDAFEVSSSVTVV